jgi:HK97 gp10 family phage protein
MTRKIDFEIAIDQVIGAIDIGASQGLAQGADMIVAQAKGLAPHRTGQLANSIQAERPDGSLSQGTLGVTIGAGAPYASFVEFGTGIHAGGDRIWIQPRVKKALRFPVPGGGFAFSKGHFIDGMRARPFITPAVENNAGTVSQIMADAIDNQLDKISRS